MIDKPHVKSLMVKVYKVSKKTRAKPNKHCEKLITIGLT